MEIPDNIIKDLQYYLSRSVFWDRKVCYNIVADEAAEGNELAQRAMAARTFVQSGAYAEYDKKGARMSLKIELIQQIGNEVCEGCGPDRDCGMDIEDCDRIENALNLLTNYIIEQPPTAKAPDAP